MTGNKVKILNVDFQNTTRELLLNELTERITKGDKTFVVTANPEIVMYANSDPEYLSIVNKSDYTIADGIGVIIGSKMLGTPLPERIPGFDLMQDLLETANKNEWSVYLLGAKKDVIEKAVENVKERHPKLKLVGWNDGYFNWESSKVADEIAKKQPDLIFVALGFPRQEMWIAKHFASFNKGLFMGVGGSFDVLSGHVKRSPEIWQKLHLEWFYRLLKQPSRWRRMLALPDFIIKVLFEKNKH
nr:WecB/TagA/CpsF family glycosyltransferase [Bacillus marasmi]